MQQQRRTESSTPVARAKLEARGRVRMASSFRPCRAVCPSALFNGGEKRRARRNDVAAAEKKPRPKNSTKYVRVSILYLWGWKCVGDVLGECVRGFICSPKPAVECEFARIADQNAARRDCRNDSYYVHDRNIFRPGRRRDMLRARV